MIRWIKDWFNPKSYNWDTPMECKVAMPEVKPPRKGIEMIELPDFYLEQIEKALRGDLRFKYLVQEDAQNTIWNLLAMLERNKLHYSYLDGGMEYKI